MNKLLLQRALDAIQFLDEMEGADSAVDYMRVMSRLAAECNDRASRCFESHIKGEIYTDTRYRDGRFIIDHMADGRVAFFPQGGGFQHFVSLADFLEHFRPAPAPTFKAGRVTGEWLSAECIGADKDVTFPAYLDGRRWNGWSMPYFTKRDAMDMLTASGNDWQFAPEIDAFVIQQDGSDEPEVYKGEDIATPYGTRHVYPVGAGCWTWETVDNEEGSK